MLKISLFSSLMFILYTGIVFFGCSGPGNTDRQQKNRSETGQGAKRLEGENALQEGLRSEASRPELPETSVYQFQGEWHSQESDTLQLRSLRGKIPIMAMVFTHCEFACPRIITDMKKIQKQLPPGKTDEVIFVLVSFDTERDQPERLKEYAREVNLDDNWLLLHGNEEDVRILSMLLDVNYQKQAGGTFAHANIITLLNKDGEIVSQIEGLGMDAGPIISKIDKL